MPREKASHSEGPKKRYKKRVKRDTAAPKSARSAYTFFLEQEHAEAKKNNPDEPFGETSKRISERWRNLDDETRAKYNAMAEQDKARFAREMESYVPTQGFGSNGKPLKIGRGKKSMRPKRDKNLPKGALTSYIIFCTQMRNSIKAENPDIANTDIMKKTGERWRAMSEEERAPWEALAAQDKQRFDDEMAVYNQNQTQEES